jgi:hypothetical protein
MWCFAFLVRSRRRRRCPDGAATDRLESHPDTPAFTVALQDAIRCPFTAKNRPLNAT